MYTTVSCPNAQQFEQVHKRARFNSASQRGTQHSNTQPQTEEQPRSYGTASRPNAQKLGRVQQQVRSQLERVHKRTRFNSDSQRGTQHSEINNQSSDSGSNQTAYANNTQPQTEEQASSHSTASRPNAQQLERVQQQVRSNSASLKQRATLLVRSMWGFRRGEMERTDG